MGFNYRGWIMRAIGLVLGLLGAAFVAMPAHASNANSGLISEITVLPNGVVLFNQSGIRSATASCQNASFPTRWAFNINTTVGQGMLSALLSAKGMGKTIRIIGTGACSDWNDTESLSYFVIEN